MSNLSAIGFEASTTEDFQREMAAAFELAAPATDLASYSKRYLWYQDSSGAALAARLSNRGSIDCATPFYVPPRPPEPWLIKTNRPHMDKECLHCSGVDCDVLERSSMEMCTRTSLQFLQFEPYLDWLKKPQTFEVAVVGFASTLHLCATPAEFEAVQASHFDEGAEDVPRKTGNPVLLADVAFLPHGMFGPVGNLGDRARAILTGTVEAVSRPRNSATGKSFVACRVRTLGGAIDIVASENASSIAEGAKLAFAECWLVYKPVQLPPPKTSLLSRVLSGWRRQG